MLKKQAHFDDLRTLRNNLAASVSEAKRRVQEQEQRCSIHQNMLNKHNAQFMLLVGGEISIALAHKSDIK